MLTEEQLTYIIELVKEYTGNIIERNKSYVIENKLQEYVERLTFDNLSEFIEYLKSTDASDIKKDIADILTVNETHFFRDETIFNCIEEYIIPQLIKQNSKTKKLSIWSAACSSGQEIYSLIILLKEKFPDILTWDLSILATDFSQRIIQNAKLAQYSEMDVSRGLLDNYLNRYFVFSNGHWILQDEIKKYVNFKQLNLTESLPIFEEFDLVLLRNVLIYFSVSDKEKILHRVKPHVSKNGFLILGSSETLININAPFVVDKLSNTHIYKPS